MMHCNVYDALQCVQDVCAVLQMICVYNTTDTVHLEHITYLHQPWAPATQPIELEKYHDALQCS